MVQSKIRPFKGLRDGKEDPAEYIEDLEWVYDQDYRGKNPTNDATITEKSYRLLFRQHLEADAYDWYTDLDKDIKQDWEKLKQLFLTSFQVTEKDAQAKKFELRMKVAQLKQEDNESIADYLKKAFELSRKMVNDEIDVGMATLRGMRDQFKREQVNFECSKGSDYSYQTVEKLIKAAYSEVGKPNPFDPSYKDTIGVELPHGRTSQSNDEMLRQVLINTNQAFPAILQGFRSLNMAANNGIVVKGSPTQPNQQQIDLSRVKKDISQIQCYVCKQFGHYASFHNTDPNHHSKLGGGA